MERRKQDRLKENLGCDTISVKASATPLGPLKPGWPFIVVSS